MKALLLQEKKKMALLKAHGYHLGRSREFILRKAQLRPGSVLEIGTGKGHFALALARRGFTVTSIDADPGPQKMARAYLRHAGLEKKVRLRVMNAQDLQFPDHSFDAVVSVNFMHHAQDPRRCLAEMVRVAGTRIVIADLNKQGEAVLAKVHQREGHRHPRSRISFPAMRELLRKKGFAVKTFRGFCQTVLVAEKGAEHENLHSHGNR